MKADELKKALRSIIKEEVRKAVQEEVSRAMGKVLVEMVKEIKKPTKQIVEEVEQDEEIVMDESPIKTNNPKLNAVLSETARRFRPLQKTVDATMGMEELMEGQFEKIGQGESVGVQEPSAPATKIDFLKSMVNPPAPQQASVLGTSAVPDVLKGVFKKDFRTMMKKIDEHKRGGMMNMSNISQG